MSRKDKVSIIRSEEFASVDDELAAALNLLENTNSRIQALLESETAIMGESPAGDTAGVNEASEAAEAAVAAAPATVEQTA